MENKIKLTESEPVYTLGEISDDYENFKIEMTPREFELLHEITEYAIKQKETYLLCLIKSEYGRDEEAIKKNAAELVSYKIFKDSMTPPYKR